MSSRQLDREMLADWIVHAVGITCGLVGGIVLLVMAARSTAEDNSFL